MDKNRLLVEQLKNVLQSMNYDLTSYALGPDLITATVKINVKDLDQTQQNIIDIQFKRIMGTQGWTVVTTQKIDDFLNFGITREV